MTQSALHLAAFWVAVLHFRRHGPDSECSLRFVVGLAAGAGLAHLAWAMLYLHEVLAQPGALLDPSTGYTVLAVPLGLLVTAIRAPAFYLSRALSALPLALAAARLGCLVAGCCRGAPFPYPGWGVSHHPTVPLEIVALVALHLWVRRAPPRFSTALVLGGFGAIRILIDPLRAAAPLGAPLFDTTAIAIGWTGIGVGHGLWEHGRAERSGSPTRRGTTSGPGRSPGRRASRRVGPTGSGHRTRV